LAQIAAHLGIGVYALRLLSFPVPQAMPRSPAKSVGVRQAQLGRIAVYVSLAYLMLMVRIPVWSAYVEVLNRSRIVREYILQNDLDRIRSDRPREIQLADQPEWIGLNILLDSGARAWSEERYVAAKQNYEKLLLVADRYGLEVPAGAREVVSLGLNNLAWLLATCPKTELRDAELAVSYATRAIALRQDDGNGWNTLGVARFRSGDLIGSRDAFDRSIAIRKGGDSFDWFFLAILDARAGQSQTARGWYDRAESWFHTNRPADGELRLIQLEAARELKLPETKKPSS
jgi:hypothetical protein